MTLFSRGLLYILLLLSLSGCVEQDIPNSIVICKIPYPEFPRGYALNIYELYGSNSDDKCVYTNQGAKLSDKLIEKNETMYFCTVNIPISAEAGDCRQIIYKH